MLGNKGQNQIRPSVLGTTVNSGTYGSTIPLVYGRTKSSMYLIWMANMRQYDAKKGKKSKGPPDYAANVDFLQCHNPAIGWLQCWVNQNQWLTLNFQKYTQASGFIGPASITVPDSLFHSCIAVTITVPYNFNYTNSSAGSVTFDDYGAQGSSTLTGTYEIPLWNAAFNGPDPVHASGCRFAPWTYIWTPANGRTIELPYAALGQYPIGGYTINVYYSQYPTFNQVVTNNLQVSLGLNGAKGTAYDPLGALNLIWEPSLGDGPEFLGTDQTSGNPLSDQRVIYAHYAGVGSVALAAGSSQTFPEIKPEIQGTFPINPTGDADFADIVEDIFYGATQAGFGNDNPQTPIQHGLNCGQRPGTVQQANFQWVMAEAPSPNSFPFPLPNVGGNWLIVIASGQNNAPPTISDTALNTWTALFPGNDNFQVWYCQARGYNHNDQGTVVTVSQSWFGEGGSQVTLLEIAGVDTLDAIITNASNTATVTTTGAQGTPMYMLAIGDYNGVGGTGGTVPPPTLWQYCLSPDTPSGISPGGLYSLQSRIVQWPGTYQYTAPTPYAGPFSTKAALHVALFAFKCSQPPNYPPSLGNVIGDILDKPSLLNVRAQDRAAGLWGSLLVDSQTKGSDLLGQLYDAMDAWFVWSGFSGKSIARSEVSAVGNGAVYIAPTAAGPIADLLESDFLTDGKPDTPPVTVTRKAQVNVPDILSVTHPSRASFYNDITVAQPEAGSIALYGPRKDSPKRMPMFQDPAVSRMYLRIQTAIQNYLRNGFDFSVNAKWWLLEPGDLITIPVSCTMPKSQGPGGTEPVPYVKIPVRILSIEADEKYGLKCTAEPFIYGCYAPLALPATQQQPFIPNTGGNPGSVNEPVIFEPVPRLAGGNTQGELWLVVSGGATAGSPPVTPSYGGCFAYISTDGGNSYNPAAPLSNGGSVVGGALSNSQNAILGNGITGWTLGDWPAAASPDSTNDLLIYIGECHGSLESYSVQDEDEYTYPCYVAGGGIGPLRVQSCSNSGQGINALSQVFPHDNNALNTILVVIGAFCDPNLDGSLTVSVTDTAGNSYTVTPLCQTKPVNDFGPASQALVFAATNIVGGPNTITVHVSGAGGGADITFAALEYSDLRLLGSPPVALEFTFSVNQSAVGANPPIATGSLSVGLPGGMFLLFAFDEKGGESPDFTITPALGWNLRESVADGPLDTQALSVWDSQTGPLGAANATIGANSTGTFHVGLIAFPPGDSATSGIPYELMTYAVAELQAPYSYRLLATSPPMSPPVINHLDRGVFGAPAPNEGVEHPGPAQNGTGSRFAFVGPPYPGTMKLALDPSWIGRTLWFKFAAFNPFLGAVQDLSDCTAYPYTPTGMSGSASGNSAIYTVTPAAVAGSPPVAPSAVLTNPTPTTIDMAAVVVKFPSNTVQYNARVFTIPAPSVPTTYYVTITDPGFVGDAPGETNLPAICQTSNVLVGLPGNTYIGSIVALPGGGGTVTGPGGWPPTGPTLLLETDGALNSSQTLLNLVEGTGVTLTDEGGGVIAISAASLTQVSEQPAGTMNGVNKVFTLSFTPTAASLKLFLNGVEQLAIGEGSPPIVNYTLSGTSITFTVAPKATDEMIAQYTH